MDLGCKLTKSTKSFLSNNNSFPLLTLYTKYSFLVIQKSKHIMQTRLITTGNNLSASSKVLSNSNFEINPWFITGFIDGEGCFYISVVKNKAYKTGLRIKLSFEIHIHKKDQVLLEQIQKFFNVSKIYSYNSTSVKYYVTSIT